MGDWEIPNAIIGRAPHIPFDCLIGNDFFMMKHFTIDVKKLSILTVDSGIKEDYLKLNVYKSEHGGHFGFDVKIAENKIGTIFDTGSASTVIDLEFVKEHPDHFLLVKEINVTMEIVPQ